MKNILFDLDGTIIDTKEGIISSLLYALKELGFDEIPEADDLFWCIGPPLQESFSILLNTKEKAKVDEGVRLYRVNYNKKGIYQFKLYDGIVETIKQLNQKGLNTYIATSKPKIMAEKIISYLELNDLFNGIYGAELDGIRSKKGVLISYLIEKEKLDKKDTIMIGDRKHDIIGAKENNIKSCGVTYGYGSNDELIENGADYIVHSPKDLLDIIKKRGAYNE